MTYVPAHMAQPVHTAATWRERATLRILVGAAVVSSTIGLTVQFLGPTIDRFMAV